MTSASNGDGRSSMPSLSSLGVHSTFKILVTTDNHLGFMERDPKRGDDSFTTFEEILRAARVEHNVDCMLLGGDLFHESKPSLGCLNRTCALFRKYLWGNKSIAFTLRSKASDCFPTHGLPVANWQDPNMNISIPVFAIHGNHDDPVGGTSSLDVLANNGHLNYFGLVSSLENIVVTPVLLQKGNTYVALYGLGNVRDDRLHRCFQLKKVHFIRPKEQRDADGAPIRWFNILLLHQNRGMRSTHLKSGITENMLAGFGFHLVLWGNEHEQRMVPEPTPYRYDVVQPGSSILTSITPCECNPKQYGVLEIRGLSYRLTPFALKSVRPIVRRTVRLCHDNPRGRTLEEVEDFLRGVVEEMVKDAERQLAGIPDDVLQFHPNIRFPLMRLYVDFSDPQSAPFPRPNMVRFGQQYMDLVANPGDMIKEIKPGDKRSVVSEAAILRRGMLGRGNNNGNTTAVAASDEEAFNYASVLPQFRSVDIATKVAEVFSSGVRPPCQILSEMELSAAVYAFAERNEHSAIEDKISEMVLTAQRMIWKRLSKTDDVLDPVVVARELHRCKVERERKFFRQLQEMKAGGDGTAKEMTEEPVAAVRAEDGDAARSRNDDRGKLQRAGGLAPLSMAVDAMSLNGEDPKGSCVGDAEELLHRRRAAPGGVLVDDDMPAFLRDHVKTVMDMEAEEDLRRTGATSSRAAKGGHEEGGEDGDSDDDSAFDYAALLGEELEDLPEAGLDRINVEDFLAREVAGADGGGGVKREEDGNEERGRKRSRRPEAPVNGAMIDVDVDVDAEEEEEEVDEVDARASKAKQPARTGRHVGQPTAAKRRGERKPRGDRPSTASTAASATAGGPTLHLIPSSVHRGGARADRVAGATPPPTVILEKWGASQRK